MESWEILSWLEFLQHSCDLFYHGQRFLAGLYSTSPLQSNNLKSLLPKRPVNFATISWQVVASLVRTTASELSGIGSQGREWMQPINTAGKWLRFCRSCSWWVSIISSASSHTGIFGKSVSSLIVEVFCATFFAKLHDANKSKSFWMLKTWKEEKSLVSELEHLDF